MVAAATGDRHLKTPANTARRGGGGLASSFRALDPEVGLTPTWSTCASPERHAAPPGRLVPPQSGMLLLLVDRCCPRAAHLPHGGWAGASSGCSLPVTTHLPTSASRIGLCACACVCVWGGGHPGWAACSTAHPPMAGCHRKGSGGRVLRMQVPRRRLPAATALSPEGVSRVPW